MSAGVFVNHEVTVLNSVWNTDIGVKTIQEQLEYKILVLLRSSCGPLRLTKKREEKVSENIFYMRVRLSQIITLLKKMKKILIRETGEGFPLYEV